MYQDITTVFQFRPTPPNPMCNCGPALQHPRYITVPPVVASSPFSPATVYDCGPLHASFPTTTVIPTTAPPAIASSGRRRSQLPAPYRERAAPTLSPPTTTTTAVPPRAPAPPQLNHLHDRRHHRCRVPTRLFKDTARPPATHSLTPSSKAQHLPTTAHCPSLVPPNSPRRPRASTGHHRLVPLSTVKLAAAH